MSEHLPHTVTVSVPRVHDAAPPEVPVTMLMARMADGDATAVFTLADQHGHRVAGVVRRQLRVCGVDHVARDDLDGLVLDACMELSEVALSWRPGLALPWWWAQGRIFQVVRRWVGVHADSLDVRPSLIEDRAAGEAASVLDEAVSKTFARLVDEVPVVGLVAEACDAARIEETAMFCLLEYRIQKDQGDPSPARTLAPRYGVSPDALRQRVSRSTRRLRAVVADDPRFAPLAGSGAVSG